jgi:hypothetical protein
MSSNKRIERRLWRWSLMLHSTFFTLWWALAFYLLAFVPPYQVDRTFPLILLMWLPFFILHLAAYFHYTARPNTVDIERQAYRDGFADGMHERANLSDGNNTGHLSVDDEGELVEEVPELRKRKREAQ